MPLLNFFLYCFDLGVFKHCIIFTCGGQSRNECTDTVLCHYNKKNKYNYKTPLFLLCNSVWSPRKDHFSFFGRKSASVINRMLIIFWQHWKGGLRGYIFRDYLSALINDTYFLQFLKIWKEDGSSTRDPRDRDGQGPVLLTRGKLMVCAQCPDRWPVTSQSNTIRTQFPNLISAVSHNKLPHSEKWEWMVMQGVKGMREKLSVKRE